MTQGESQVTVYKQQSTPVKTIVKGFLTIKQFATLCRTTVRTIRFYDKKGLIRPASVDPYTKYRYYHPHQAREFFKIKLIQSFNVPLKKISSINEGSFLDQKLADIKEEIKDKEKQYSVLQTIKSDLIDKQMQKHIKIKTVGPFYVFGKEFLNARYDRINADIMGLYKKAKELKLSTTQSEHVLYLEPHTYGPHQTKLQISLILSKLPKQIPNGYYAKKIPAQKFLTYFYKGPYPYLTFVHQEMYAIAKKHGFLKGYPFDIHTKDPLNIKSEYDYETLVGYPME